MSGEQIHVRYHREGNIWWAEVTNPGWRFSATDNTLPQLRERTRDLIAFGVDERLRARSVMFLEVKESPCVEPSASETFVLYSPHEGQPDARRGEPR